MGYFEFTVKRFVSAVTTLFIASIAIFSILRLIPGDPAVIILGEAATEASIQAQRERLGLNLPVHHQYINWLTGVLTLQMGSSIASGTDIASYIFARYPRSMALALTSLFVAILIAIPAGIISATNRNNRYDYITLVATQIGISFPQFVLGIFLIMIFSASFGVLPSSGYVSPFDDLSGFIAHLALPAVTLGLINAAVLTRFVRSEMLEQLNEDYVRTAYAYGLNSNFIERKYVLRNALAPALTVVGLQFAKLMGGLVIIEEVFSYPGMGILILDALFARDYPVLQVGLLVVAGTFIVANFIIDLLYGWLNPKIRY